MNTFFDSVLNVLDPPGEAYDPSIARPICKVCSRDAWLSWTGKYSDYCSVECEEKDAHKRSSSPRNRDLPHRERTGTSGVANAVLQASAAKKIARSIRSKLQQKNDDGEGTNTSSRRTGHTDDVEQTPFRCNTVVSELPHILAMQKELENELSRIRDLRIAMEHNVDGDRNKNDNRTTSVADFPSDVVTDTKKEHLLDAEAISSQSVARDQDGDWMRVLKTPKRMESDDHKKLKDLIDRQHDEQAKNSDAIKEILQRLEVYKDTTQPTALAQEELQLNALLDKLRCLVASTTKKISTQDGGASRETKEDRLRLLCYEQRNKSRRWLLENALAMASVAPLTGAYHGYVDVKVQRVIEGGTMRLKFGDRLFCVVWCPVSQGVWKQRETCKSRTTEWGDTLRFQVLWDHPAEKYVVLEVWKNDRSCVKNFIGMAEVPLPAFVDEWKLILPLTWNCRLDGVAVRFPREKLRVILKFSADADSVDKDILPGQNENQKTPSEDSVRNTVASESNKSSQQAAVTAKTKVDTEASEMPTPRDILKKHESAVLYPVRVHSDSIVLDDGDRNAAEVSEPEPIRSSRGELSVDSSGQEELLSKLLQQMETIVAGSNRQATRTDVWFPLFDQKILKKHISRLPLEAAVCTNLICNRVVHFGEFADLYEEEEFRAWGICSLCQRNMFTTVIPEKWPNVIEIGEYAPLREFLMSAPVPVIFPDCSAVWCTARHLLEAQCFEDIEIQEYIRKCRDLDSLKVLLDLPTLPLFIRGDWESFRHIALKNCLYLKIQQHPRLKLLLSATNSTPIVYKELYAFNDRLQMQPSAENVAGNFLMEIRDALFRVGH